MDYQIIIGLEVHAQLKTKTKIFCRCRADQNSPPNSNICPICLGHPGVLPSLNKKVVDFATTIALALNCKINTTSTFDRKNYFYPDLPKGYQITQFETPIAEDGYIAIEIDDNEKNIGIQEMHIEEDSGKQFHPEGSGFPYSLIDMNRASVPLVEIVSKPDMRSPKEAVQYLKRLRQLLRYLDVSDCNMEMGNFRCDANVSLLFSDGSCTNRREVKNLNSFRSLERALKYEVGSQKRAYDKGIILQSCTLAYDEKTGKTSEMREKETSSDYRYFPEPDLPPLVLSSERISYLKDKLPELPWQRKQRFIFKYNMRDYDAEILTTDYRLADTFEKCAKKIDNQDLVTKWFIAEYLRVLKELKITAKDFPVDTDKIIELLRMITENKITKQSSQKLFTLMVEENGDPIIIAKREKLFQLSDSDELENIVESVINDFPKEVKAYKEGKDKLLAFFIGQVMYRTKGNANPEITRALLSEKLSQ